MTFASFDTKIARAPMAEINMVPLIDVMLVLLVIFIVTAPLLTKAVKLALPKVNAEPNVSHVEKIEFAIEASGTLYWSGEPIDRAEAKRRFELASRQQPQPEIHLHADQEAPYRLIAQTLGDAAQVGLSRIGFISEPAAP